MKIIKNLKLEDYQHPYDRASMGEVRRIPFLNKAINWITENAVERVSNILYTGSNFRVTNDSCPELYSTFEKVLRTLDMEQIPSLYTTWDYQIDSDVVGDQNPILMLTTGAVDLLDEEQLMFALGIECGHIKAKHLKYKLIYQSLDLIKGSGAIKIAMNYWARMSEYTADRVGLLACQNIDTAIKVMMKTSGVPKSVFNKINKENFIQQVLDFEKNTADDFANAAIDVILITTSQYPWIIRRAAQLIDWYENGNYNNIINNN